MRKRSLIKQKQDCLAANTRERHGHSNTEGTSAALAPVRKEQHVFLAQRCYAHSHFTFVLVACYLHLATRYKSKPWSITKNAPMEQWHCYLKRSLAKLRGHNGRPCVDLHTIKLKPFTEMA
eukprot:Blabericola_migrator_1__12891@NODE_842_length_6289_cov_33_263742_g594_i0_p7_GENE_NODE_842_length_6289_cov_33_263742_g594_i0NODE_842_length_6289_cov_33_263742_g594_i0_p7_ORF_typecomplete_len121_score3_12_NODE_842_length_6289_cov_33_263742_g594_i037024064